MRDALALVFALVFPSIITWLYFVQFSGTGSQPNGFAQLAFAIGKCIQFGFPIGYIWLVHRREIGWKHLQIRNFTIGLAFGVVAALGILALYFSWLKPAELLQSVSAIAKVKLQNLGCNTPMQFLLLACFYCLIHSLLEEYYWRWFVFGRLQRHVAFPVAVMVASLGFMAHHVILLWVYLPNDFWTLAAPFSLCVAAGGAFWCWLYHNSGSLFGPWISHLLVDAAIFAIGYDLVMQQ